MLSGLAAAFLYGLTRRQPGRPEVTAPGRRRVRGVATKRTRNLDPRDVTTFRAIPITTVGRTLVDIAADLGAGELARAVHEAAIRHRTTPQDSLAALERKPNATGARKLRRTAAASARRAPAVTSTGATPTATCTRSRHRCSPS